MTAGEGDPIRDFKDLPDLSSTEETETEIPTEPQDADVEEDLEDAPRPPIRGRVVDLPGISICTEMISGPVADFYLEYNNKNRKPKEGQIARVYGSIGRREWVFNGEAVSFSFDGERVLLTDGQNRLHAISRYHKDRPEENVELPCLVVRGLSPSALWTIDDVVKRSLSDALFLSGYQNCTNLAATLNVLHCWKIGEQAIRNKTRFRLTASQGLVMIESDLKGAVPALREAERIHRKMVRLAPMSIIAACWYMFEQIDPDDCARFFGQLSTGQELPSGSPVLALRQVLTRNSNATVSRGSIVIHAWIIKAWNFFRSGQSVAMISWRVSEPFPTPMGGPS